MEDKIKILTEIFDPSPQAGFTPKQDLQLAITLNPNLDRFLEAMDKHAELMCEKQRKICADAYASYFAWTPEDYPFEPIMLDILNAPTPKEELENKNGTIKAKECAHNWTHFDHKDSICSKCGTIME